MVEDLSLPDQAPPSMGRPQQLTSENLKKHETASQASKAKANKKRKAGKPAWATTEKEQEEQKEAEIDDLLEFAYELDYEKYMEDYEVRQALAIIKDRVQEMTKEEDWKERLADEWNQANAEEAAAVRKSRPKPPAAGSAPGDNNFETRSQVTYRKLFINAAKLVLAL